MIQICGLLKYVIAMHHPRPHNIKKFKDLMDLKLKFQQPPHLNSFDGFYIL